MLKIEIQEAVAHVDIEFAGCGSVQAETVETSCSGVKATLKILSSAADSRIAKLARLAEAGCYVIQSLRRPVAVDYEVVLNGKRLSVGEE